MSSSGKYQVACTGGGGIISGYIYYSKDSGASWTTHPTAGLRSWSSVSLSANGSTISATTNDESGAIWTYTMPDDQYRRPPAIANSTTSTVVTASAGQYLAGDRGVTLDISRTFNNGTSVGAFITKTNVSAQTFGEGSFDKGIYVSVPMDSFLIRSSNTYANLLWKPLTRDGGAKLNRTPTLNGVTQIRDVDAFSHEVPRPDAPAASGTSIFGRP